MDSNVRQPPKQSLWNYRNALVLLATLNVLSFTWLYTQNVQKEVIIKKEYITEIQIVEPADAETTQLKEDEDMEWQRMLLTIQNILKIRK
jgi:hypothetical protein